MVEPEDTLSPEDLMLAASQAIKPSKDPIGLRARLAARLDSFNVDSLI